MSAAPSFFRRIALRATVLYTGAVLLAIEVMAVRILSPYFGNTIFNFSSVLSVILGALALGYWYGGKFADKNPSEKIFYGVVALSGVFVLVMQGLSAYFLPSLGESLPVVFGPLFASLAFFFLPACLFGLLSPFAVKLATINEPEKGVGTVSGEIFFFSTIGSITGSLVSGFVLIPSFGITSSIFVMGVSLIVIGAIGAWRSFPGRTAVYFFGICALLGLGAHSLSAFAPPYVEGDILYDDDGWYGRIVIVEGQYLFRQTRMLRFDHSLSSAVFVDDPSKLPFPYMNFFFVYRQYIPSPKRIAVLGSAMNAVPKMILSAHKETVIDAVEIEPSFPELARVFFDVPDDPRLINHTFDGRRFLRTVPDEAYDVIVADAFHSFFSIPWHMATKEFYGDAYRTLSPGGLYVMNVISMNDTSGPTMLYSTVATMKKVFTDVAVLAVHDPSSTAAQNFIVIGSKGKDLTGLQNDLLRSSKPFLNKLATYVLPMTMFENSSAPILTDSYAPTDVFTARLLLKGALTNH